MAVVAASTIRMDILAAAAHNPTLFLQAKDGLLLRSLHAKVGCHATSYKVVRIRFDSLAARRVAVERRPAVAMETPPWRNDQRSVRTRHGHDVDRDGQAPSVVRRHVDDHAVGR